jgi:beta-lactam-binding protein with PASTA domain
MSVAQATSALKRAGFSVSTTTRTVSSGSDGVVLSENPSGGTSEMPGTDVQITVAHLYVPPPPPPPAASQPPAQHSCTLTNSGTCIRGGEFCRQADYGTTGYDADGRAWVCTGSTTHPHWE